MKIKSLYLKSYGKFEDKKIDFSDSFNVVYGKNESGKSTVMSFIKAMLYGFEGKGNDLLTNDRKKYLPWSGKGVSGEADIVTDSGEHIKIIREMGKTHKQDSLQAINIKNGEEYEYSFSDVMGIGEDAFSKFFYIREGASKLSGENEEIAQMLINLAHSGSEEVNFHSAADRVLSEIKKLKALKGQGGKIGELEKRISDLNQELRSAEEYRRKFFDYDESLRELEKDEKKLTAEIAKIEEEKSKSIICEKYNLLRDCEKELDGLKEKYNALCAEESEYQNDLETLSQYANTPNEAIFEPIPEIKQKSKLGIMRTSLAAVGLVAFTVMSLYNILSLIPAAICSVLFGFFLKSEVSGRREADKVKTMRERVIKELERFDAKDLRDYYDKKSTYDRAKEKTESIQNILDDLETKIGEKEAEFEQIRAEIGDRTMPENIRSAAQLAEDETIARETIQEVRIEKSRIEGLLAADGGEYRTPDIILTDRAFVKEEYDKAVARHTALCAAYEALRTAYSRISSDFTPLVNKRASEILKEITGKYDDIITNKDFSVIINSGGAKQLASFSSGTIDQVYMAIRLAVTDILFGCDKPLFIDDALLLYDNEREERILRYFEKRASDGQQVVLFSCKKPPVSPETNIISLT